MKTAYDLTSAAQAGIHFGLDKLRGLRAVASTVLCRYARDIAAGWKPRAEDYASMAKIRNRFRLPVGIMEGMTVAYEQDRKAGFGE